MSSQQETFRTAAYGGPGWSQRTQSLAQEIGGVWGGFSVNSEWRKLEAVLLHRPGDELGASLEDHDAVQMLAPVDLGKAQAQHDAMAEAYRANGVMVHYVDPAERPSPNQMFCADLFFMTHEGAILARPASTVRAGEERQVQRRLADLGVPILRGLSGRATFEGADAMWLDETTIIVGRGLRTNSATIEQIWQYALDASLELIAVDMPYGTMHLMGMLRIFDRNLAMAWPRLTPHAAVEALRDRGYEVGFLPDLDYTSLGRAFNVVTLGPRRILMVAGYPEVERAYEAHGVECVTVEADELVKAAGAVGCLTGILSRERD